MPRETLTRQLHQIQDEILFLGSMIEKAMLDAVDALKRRDTVTARRIMRDDQLVNEKRYAIENAILILIATQQPMAHDLRMLAAMLEVITELERMGDYAKGIGKVTIRLEDEVIPITFQDITEMAEKAVSMLHRSLGAFMDENPSLAARIPEEDDEVDRLYNKVYREAVDAMIANPAIIDHANLMMWVVHNIERMADRVTNICERTLFIATGELMELDSSDDEDAE